MHPPAERACAAPKSSGVVACAGMGNPLTALRLEQLRTRTSAKWRVHPPDVLPLWVAEMDVPLAGAGRRGA